jgi:hypothetical protein
MHNGLSMRVNERTGLSWRLAKKWYTLRLLAWKIQERLISFGVWLDMTRTLISRIDIRFGTRINIALPLNCKS